MYIYIFKVSFFVFCVHFDAIAAKSLLSLHLVMKKLFGILVLGLLVLGCEKPLFPNRNHSGDRKLLLYYAAGFNSLSGYLKDDIRELCNNEKIPTLASNDDILLIYSHLSNGNDYATPKPSALYRVYKNRKGIVVRDTLVVYDESICAAKPETFKNVLDYIDTHFEYDSKGLIFSSHGFGYLPEGYYSSPTKYEGSSDNWFNFVHQRPSEEVPQPIQGERLTLEVMDEIAAASNDVLQTKTIGQEYISSGSVSVEMNIDDFAEAISSKFDYILFDACLMAGIEVAYELRNVADYIGFSPTEILADGLPYDVILDYLFADGQADPEGVCRLYMKRYFEEISPSYATFSFIKTSALEGLADVCKDIFQEHREDLLKLKSANIQGYYRYNRHYFYDLGHMVHSLPLTDSQKASFDAALDDVVIYEDATEQFFDFKILNHCGLSTMLPSACGDYLKEFYLTLSWNKAVKMVE